jgi:hypothetical protein
VEQRSFWNIFRSFDRLWIGYLLVLQACVVTLWHGGGPPWIELQKRDSLARFLSIFISWAILRLLQGNDASSWPCQVTFLQFLYLFISCLCYLRYLPAIELHDMVSGTNHIVKVWDTFCCSLLTPQQEPEKVGTIRIGLNKILMPLYIVCWLTAVLDIGSQYSLVTRETLLIGVRMFLKVLVATAWVILFIIYYRFVQLTDFFRVLDFLSCVCFGSAPLDSTLWQTCMGRRKHTLCLVISSTELIELALIVTKGPWSVKDSYGYRLGLQCAVIVLCAV